MNFEEALVYELSSIEGLEGKIFPLGATEGTEPPFVIYVSSEGTETQTLNGFTGSMEVVCEIYIIGETYGEMKRFLKAILSKLKTFYGRQIGIDGMLIKSFNYDEPREEHIEDLGWERSAFDIRVRF